MWEIFTCGKMPYGRLKNTEVVDRVQRGIILEKPKMCFKEVYEVYYILLFHDLQSDPYLRMKVFFLFIGNSVGFIVYNAFKHQYYYYCH